MDVTPEMIRELCDVARDENAGLCRVVAYDADDNPVGAVLVMRGEETSLFLAAIDDMVAILDEADEEENEHGDEAEEASDTEEITASAEPGTA